MKFLYYSIYLLIKTKFIMTLSFNKFDDNILIKILSYSEKNETLLIALTCKDLYKILKIIYPETKLIISLKIITSKLNLLKYAFNNGCPWNESTCHYAAKNGNLECLKYAFNNGCPWDELTCSNAASNGHLECLKYAHNNGCPWYEYTCYYAAQNGHLECLKYTHTNGCPWTKYTCSHAASNGQLECLKYAFSNGCPWDTDEILSTYISRLYRLAE